MTYTFRTTLAAMTAFAGIASCQAPKGHTIETADFPVTKNLSENIIVLSNDHSSATPTLEVVMVGPTRAEAERDTMILYGSSRNDTLTWANVESATLTTHLGKNQPHVAADDLNVISTAVTTDVYAGFKVQKKWTKNRSTIVTLPDGYAKTLKNQYRLVGLDTLASPEKIIQSKDVQNFLCE